MAEYIPVLELPSINDFSPSEMQVGDMPPLIWDFAFPPSLDAERLQINMSALAWYRKVGAFRSSVVLDYQGERTESTPGIAGINDDGTAIATRASSVTKADKSESDIVDPPYIPSYYAREFGKSVVIHRLNKAEIANTIANESSDRKTSREAAWATEIDGGLRDSFRRGGREHLVGRSNIGRKADYLTYGACAVLEGLEIPSGHMPIVPLVLLAGVQVTFVGIDAIGLKLETGSTLLSEKRWSIFYRDHQSDRYLALNALSRVIPIVSARK